MKKENFYTIIIVALLLLNLGTLGYLWTERRQPQQVHMPPRQGQEAPLRFMADELGMSDDQFRNLRDLARKHGRSLDSIQQRINHARTSLYLLAKDSVLDTVKRNEYLKEVEANESAKHMLTLAHFHDIRAMLTEEQQDKFNVFVEDIAKHMAAPRQAPGGHKGPPPPLH